MSTHLLSRYRRVVGHVLPLLAIWTGVLVALVLLLALNRLWGAGLVLLLLAAIVARRLVSRAGGEVAARAALVLGSGFAISRASGWDAATLATVSLILAVIMAEATIEPQLAPTVVARNLPGLHQPVVARIPTPLFLSGSLSAGMLAAAVLIGLPPSAVLIVVIVLTVLAFLIAVAQLMRRRGHTPEHEINAALSTWAPGYYIYFDGKPEAAYQVQMWLPYLERTGEPGALIIRDRSFLERALEITSMPVVFAGRVEPLEDLLVPSVGAIFYVNNAALNIDGTRYPQVLHVHLGHGDSDKPSSYAASTVMFDRIFVAGQAGADRFATHGVEVPAKKFVLVGRPQVEAVDVRSSDEGLPERPVVLYAPTWRGVLADMQLSSLDSGLAIVEALLAAGAQVLFRPHPFSARDASSRVLVKQIDDLIASAPGEGHVGSAAARQLSIFECINASDALVTDVSSVASDYLYSNKPLALTHRGDPTTISNAYPLAKAAQLLRLEDELGQAISDWLAHDPQRVTRTQVRRYYLGPWPAADYPQVFVAAALDAIVDGRRRRTVETAL